MSRFVKSSSGFTLVELVMVIVLLGILSATAYVKWPSGLDDKAALLELKRAIRYAQHVAVTRAYDPDHLWGIEITANKFTVTDGTGAVSADFDDRYLLGDADMSVTGIDLYFNGLGEPVSSAGIVLSAIAAPSFTVNGTSFLTVCPQTGYVMEGATCP